MASDSVLDLEGLIAEIRGDSPAGVNVREDPAHDSPYRLVRQLRTKATREEKDAAIGTVDAEPKPLSDILIDQRVRPASTWREIREKAFDILAKQSKDLEVAATLIEALLRLDGFEGLRSGFRLVRELAERYWDDLYPRPDDIEGPRARVTHLGSLSGEDREGPLIAPIRRTPLFRGDGAPCLAEFDMTEQPNAKTLDELERVMSSAGAAVLAASREEIRGAIDDLRALDDVLTARCGPDAPSLGNIRQALEKCEEVVSRYLPVEEGEAVEAGAGASAPAAGGNGTIAVPSGEMSREEALRALQRIADYFRRTEPHSPMSWAIEQTVRWGKMSMPDLWSELIPDSSRGEVFRLIGVPRKEEN